MLKNIKIRHQLNMLVAVIGGLMILLAIVYIVLLAQIRVQSEQSTALLQVALKTNQIASATQYMAYNMSSYSLGHFENREEFEEHLRVFDTALEEIGNYKAVLTAKEQAELDKVAATRTQYEQSANTLFESANGYYKARTQEDRDAKRIQLDKDWGAQDFLGRRLDIVLSDLSFDLDVRAVDANDSREQTIRAANGIGLVLPILIIGLSISIIFAIRRAIANPITKLTDATDRFAKGDYSHRTGMQSRNEFGDLGNSFNSMADAIEFQFGEVEKARDRAEKSDQVKSSFLASMSHELRTPLNAIINFTRFVVDGDVGPVNEQQTELLTEVVGSAKHLLNLINDVLDMSKIEADSLKLFIEDDVNLNALLSSVVATGKSLLAGKPTRLHTEIEENIPLISADRQRILQILLNIMSNACKFTEEGEIRVKVERKNDEVLITMSDTGPGVAPEDQGLVFEAFKQTKTGLRQGGGTGLGMPIAKSLTEAHGGRLWLESEYGKGATFYVALPIKNEKLVPMSA